MEVRYLDKAAYAGRRFTVRYRSPGYYDIRAAGPGFRVEYVPDETAAERSMEDEFFGKWLDDPVAWGAFEGETLLGFAEGAFEAWNGRFRISNLCVFDGAMRRRKVGSALMEAILKEAVGSGARMAVLETHACNAPAVAFYRRHGFEIIGFDLYAYSNEDPRRHTVRIEMGKKLEKERGRRLCLKQTD